MVRILRVGSLRIDSMVASVVVLPLPVGPVMTIMPCGSCSSCASLRLVVRRQAELADVEQAAIARQQADHGGFAVLRRHGGDADVDLGLARRAARAAPSCGSRRSAMLRPARILMREISACGSASAGAGTARSRPSTRMRTTSPLRNGSMWMSLARSSIALSRAGR